MTINATDGVVSNKTIDDLLASAKTSSEIVENLRQFNLDQSARGAVAPPPSETQQPSREPVRATAFRIIYPYENARFEIVGVDEKDLNAQEEAIRKLYATRK